eukprot:CCRYP_005700-RA/>CCRYP_005700-RA protein AED:0.40 eAED:0.40 QI:90/1/1/1/0/0/2/34/51
MDSHQKIRHACFVCVFFSSTGQKSTKIKNTFSVQNGFDSHDDILLRFFLKS